MTFEDYAKQRVKRPKYDPSAYARAKQFMDLLKTCRCSLTTQQIRTLRGQALSGDIDGAYKGLECALRSDKK